MEVEGREKFVGVRDWIVGVRDWIVGVRGWIVDRLGVEGLVIVDRVLARVERRGAVGTDRLCVTIRLGVEREIEGVERRTLGAVLRVGADRCGVGRATEREGARLGVGADRLACELLCDRAWLRLLLRALRREFWASAASDSSRTAATARATQARR